MAFISDRLGPNRTGPQGVLQSIADAFKMMGKEDFRPLLADPVLFTLAPVMVMIGAVAIQLVLPYTGGPHRPPTSTWASSSSSPSPASRRCPSSWAAGRRATSTPWSARLRAAAQMISYEIPMLPRPAHRGDDRRVPATSTPSSPPRRTTSGSPSTRRSPSCIFYIASIAELNRGPFDLPEGESELVAGYAHRVLGHALRHVLPQRVRRPDHHVHGRRHAVLRRLDGPLGERHHLARASAGSASSGSSPRRTSWCPCWSGSASASRACRSTSSWLSPGRSSSRSAWSTSSPPRPSSSGCRSWKWGLAIFSWIAFFAFVGLLDPILKWRLRKQRERQPVVSA